MSILGLRVGPFDVIEPVPVPERGPWVVARRVGTARKQPNEVLVKLLPPDATLDERAGLQVEFDHLRAVESFRTPSPLAVYDGLGALVLNAPRAEPLSRVVSGRRSGEVVMSPATLLDLALEIADTLQGAHHKGRVHGHVQPGEIGLAQDGRVWVYGFGPGPFAVSDLEWTAPERRRQEPPTPATDQWGLAATLTALVTGAAPTGPEDIAPVEAQWPALGRLLRRMLDPEPANRFPSFVQVRQELFALSRRAGSASERRELAARLHRHRAVASLFPEPLHRDPVGQHVRELEPDDIETVEARPVGALPISEDDVIASLPTTIPVTFRIRDDASDPGIRARLPVDPASAPDAALAGGGFTLRRAIEANGIGALSPSGELPSEPGSQSESATHQTAPPRAEQPVAPPVAHAPVALRTAPLMHAVVELDSDPSPSTPGNWSIAHPPSAAPRAVMAAIVSDGEEDVVELDADALEEADLPLVDDQTDGFYLPPELRDAPTHFPSTADRSSGGGVVMRNRRSPGPTLEPMSEPRGGPALPKPASRLAPPTPALGPSADAVATAAVSPAGPALGLTGDAASLGDTWYGGPTPTDGAPADANPLDDLELLPLRIPPLRPSLAQRVAPVCVALMVVSLGVWTVVRIWT